MTYSESTIHSLFTIVWCVVCGVCVCVCVSKREYVGSYFGTINSTSVLYTFRVYTRLYIHPSTHAYAVKLFASVELERTPAVVETGTFIVTYVNPNSMLIVTNSNAMLRTASSCCVCVPKYAL